MFARFALIATIAAAPALAQDVVSTYGITTFPSGTLKYPADFAHFDYVNPDAPKGGEISVWAFGSFDSMNPYVPKGRAAGLSNVAYEALLSGNADEIGSAYCLICASMADRSARAVDNSVHCVSNAARSSAKSRAVATASFHAPDGFPVLVVSASRSA